MTTKVKIAVGAAAIFAAAIIGVLLALSSRAPTTALGKGSGDVTTREQSPVARDSEKSRTEQPKAASDRRQSPDARHEKMAKAVVGTAPEPTQMTEAEEKAEEESKIVDEFYSAVDKWIKPSKGKTVSMADVDAFREAFRKVPKKRKEECVHRALNLIPDDNVMLLAGILFDKEQDKTILDLVFNDILNRDEDVKKPILKEVFKDREHPNWADTAWILDVTGELPASGRNK